MSLILKLIRSVFEHREIVMFSFSSSGLLKFFINDEK